MVHDIALDGTSARHLAGLGLGHVPSAGRDSPVTTPVSVVVGAKAGARVGFLAPDTGRCVYRVLIERKMLVNAVVIK